MKTTVIAAFTCIVVAFSFCAHADEIQQFQHSVTVGGKPGAVLTIGYAGDAANINKLTDLVAGHANEAYNLISSEVSRLNRGTSSGPVSVSWQTAEFLDNALQVSNWTKTDILAAPGSTGSYKDIKVNKNAKTVEINKEGIRLQITPAISGYLADLMIRYINASGMQNALVKVGNVFRGIGDSMHGPWKIQVQEDSTQYAKHSLNLTVSNAGASTISSTQFPGRQIYDPGSKQNITAKCKGATIIMNEASLAEGVAYAIMIMGSNKGQKTLSKMKNARGLIIENSGRFIRWGL